MSCARASAWPCVFALALLGCVQRGPRDDAYGGQATDFADGGAAALGCGDAQEGCPCSGNQPPVACQPEHAAAHAAAGVCEEGTRYCRGGRFSACEGVRSYAVPDAPQVSALIDPNLAHARCSDCDPNRYRIRDDLDPAEGPLDHAFSNGLSYHSSGAGLTLTPSEGAINNAIPDAGVPDGSVYLGIPEGLTASASHSGRVRPAQSDVYLLLDQSQSMAEATGWLYDRMGDGALIDDATRCSQAASAAAGIAGALQCISDNPELGLGMFRDIPFEPYATDQSLPAGARAADAKNEIAFRQQSAQSSDLLRVKAGIAALGGVESSGDPDVAASQIVALSSIASGHGLFMGLDRTSVPDAPACSGSRIGYPCFRAANPIVLLITDAPFHNGPLASMYPYDYASDLTISSGTVPGQTRIPPQNDDWQHAFQLSGDAANSLAVFYGSTAALHADVPAALVGCGADDAANDALFKFDVVAPGGAGAKAHVTLSLAGSSFDGALGVFDGVALEPQVLPPADHTNELFSSAYDLGDVSARDVLVNGDTSASGADMSADYQAALFGAACGANTLAPDAAFAFNLGAAAPAQLELQLDSGAAHGVLAVYAQGGALPEWPLRTSPLVATGNVDASPAHVFAIPSGAGQEYVSVTGDSSASSSSFDESVFGAAECAPDAGSKDVAFAIHVSGNHHLRFDTEGTAFDTVLALYASVPPTKSDPPMTFDGYLVCDDDGVAGTTSSVLDRTLSDGDYYLVLKGKHAADAGAYVLTVRDVDAVTTAELGCDASLGAGDTARVTFTAMPGVSYYALVKGAAPVDKGAYSLRVRDLGVSNGGELACDGGSGAAQLDLQLASGSYYAVLKGRAADAAGDYRLTIGGASPVTLPFTPPAYAGTVAALKAERIRVGTVLACSGGAACDDANAQAQQLAHDTGGVVQRASAAADVPLQVVKALQTMESFDTVRAQILFSPDPNPGFIRPSVTPLADAANGCSGATDPTGFRSCTPGANPTFRVSLTNPALAPVATAPSGTYHFTLRITGRRANRRVFTQDVPLFVAASGAAAAGSYSSGSYHQDIEGACTQVNQRPSWDRLTFDADVRPDTRVTLDVCSADSVADLATCDDGSRSSGYKRVVTASAGSGNGHACSVATQAQDCPFGYCSPYTNVCNELEGAACAADADCPGAAAGSCRAGANAAMIGTTCQVVNALPDPSSALGADNFRAFVRVRANLESLGNGSRTPALFFWEAQYRCRNVE